MCLQKTSIFPALVAAHICCQRIFFWEENMKTLSSNNFLARSKAATATLSIAASLVLTGCSGAKEPTLQAPLDAAELPSYLERPASEEVIYFLLPDRFENGDSSNDKGGLQGDPLDHGFDPTHKGFYHGGDLKGLLKRMDYLEGMGITAIWMAPIFKNKPVQGVDPHISAGYHGYWITDFTQIDPHLGTNEDLKQLVDEAHKRNIKVIFDIITNHTADVIKYKECHTETVTVPGCPYRNKAEYPYTRRGGIDGPEINEGFIGDDVEGQTKENFAKLTDLRWAYTPFVSEEEKSVKVPAWLNDLKYYHHRGETTFEGENSLYGDFAGLDDLFTEHPEVVEGFIDIYKHWISEFKIDGFRVDTVRHVNDSFWQKLSPALVEHAKAEGIEHFYIFGEVFDSNPERLSHFTNVAKLPAVLDFGFQHAAYQALVEKKGTKVLADLFKQDTLYTGSEASATFLPTFLGNHDMGRFAMMLNRELPDATQEEKLARVKLAHALMFFARGVPVIYSGDEQGFTGDGHDQDAREDMFKSQVAIYNDNILLGTNKTTADENFDTDHPLYLEFANLSRLYRAHPALRHGDQKEVFSSGAPGLYAFERTDGETSYLVALNTSTSPIQADAALKGGNWLLVSDSDSGGDSGSKSAAANTIPALGYLIYQKQ